MCPQRRCLPQPHGRRERALGLHTQVQHVRLAGLQGHRQHMVAVRHRPVHKRLEITAALPHITPAGCGGIQVDLVQCRIGDFEQPLRGALRSGLQLDAQPER